MPNTITIWHIARQSQEDWRQIQCHYISIQEYKKAIKPFNCRMKTQTVQRPHMEKWIFEISSGKKKKDITLRNITFYFIYKHRVCGKTSEGKHPLVCENEQKMLIYSVPLTVEI